MPSLFAKARSWVVALPGSDKCSNPQHCVEVSKGKWILGREIDTECMRNKGEKLWISMTEISIVGF